MQYNADILLNLKYNERSLDRVAATVGRVQALAKQIQPINLFAPGAGAGADQVNIAMQKIQKRAEAIRKSGSQQISATYAGAAQTADAFAEVLRNVNIEARKGTVSLDAQSDKVKDLALAYAEAASKANLLSDRYDTIIQQARQQLGLQIGPATRLGTVEADAEAAAARAQATYQAQINKNLRTDVLYQRLKLNLLVEQSETLLKQDSLMARLAKKAADYGGAGKFTENLALGVGFPLLFGGGPGSVLGSALGSFFGKGFGGQILGGALGAQLDTAVKKAIDLGNAVRDVDLERLQELGILITQDLRTQVQLYKQLGDQAAAQAVVAEQVAIQTGVFAEAQQDVANAGNLLNGTWQNFTATISNTVGLIGTPFAAALTGALTIVNGLLKTVNFIVSGFGLAIKRVAEFAIGLTGGEDALKNLNAWITMFNGKLDDGVEKASKLTAELSKRISGVDIKLNLARATQVGGTVSDELSNVKAQESADLEQLRLDYIQKQRDLAFQLADASKEAIDKNYELLKIEYDKSKQLIKQEATNKANLILRREEDKLAREAAREAERADRVQKQTNQLTARVALSSKLLEIDRQIAAATLDEQETNLVSLSIDRAMAETAGKVAEIRAQELPIEQENLKIKEAQNELETSLLKIDLDRAVVLRDRQKTFNDMFANLEYEVEYEKAITREQREQLQLSEELRKAQKQGFTPKQLGALSGKIQEQQKQQRPLQSYITDAERQLNDLERYAVAVSDGIGTAIATSMSEGVEGLIAGTKDAQQVFADFLKSVGDVLIQEGTRMIAMYIAIGIAKAFAGLGGGKGEESTSEFMKRTANLDLVGGSYPNLMGFAEGGFVTGPTNAVVGEGGEPEYIIPASKMRNAMNRYAAGARGSSVIPGSGEQAAASTGGGTAVAAPIDVRYTVERINNVDYVTADQFRSGMQQAAEQGARRGEQRTLANLRQNTTTRRKLGL